VSSRKDEALLRRSWTVPILTMLHSPGHFCDIRRGLRPITDRALSQSLKSMEAKDWVCRNIDATARPPRTLYRAVNTGGRISQVTGSRITGLAGGGPSP